MLRIRKVADATTAVNRSAIEAAQTIMREQFPAMPDYDIAKLPEQLANPIKHRFVSRLFVAENARDQTLGLALLLHAPDLDFCYLELISAAVGRTGHGIGATLYERVREEARALGAQGLYFETLPDDPALSPNPEIRARNAARLKFYERYGARPIANTAYETPITPGQSDPPYLVLDPLGNATLPARDRVKKVVHAILERKYGAPPAYVVTVVNSIKDDPVALREPRYIKSRRAQKGEVREAAEPRVALVLNDDHVIHHVQERGYVEAPVRIRSIMAELDASGLFQKVPAKRYSDRHIRAVHDGRLVDYIRKACLMAGSKKSIYPYVFPTRNPARPPKDETVLAGYYCIDTFTPLNQNAYLAARSAVDCALTAAERVLEGADLAYALVRPPGHHAETRTFGGFCYFNNGAIAANLLSRYGRVAILDIDYHHGNGQQEIFYNRADVLTVSIHGHPSFAYPYFSGFRDETGTGPGAGYNLNIPLPEHITTEQHRNAVAEGLRRIRRFAPAFLVVSLGLDTARGDPTGTWPNRARDFDRLGQMIGEQGYSTLVVQEGGYRVRTLGANVRSFFNGLVTGRSSARQVAPALARSAAARTAHRNGLDWRSAVMADDVGRVRSLVASTGFFNAAEVDIAGELVTERLTKGTRSGYHFVLAERGSTLVAYACYGPIEGTRGSFDLYWIAVAPEEQGKGLGVQVFTRAEAAMRKAGAKHIYADTSSSDRYAGTRGFYQRMGFTEEARLSDFYGTGDGKVIYVKALAPFPPPQRHPGESRDPDSKEPS
ncbi:MAG TPA: acetylpolyamine amidohydrolase [Rhizobiales bacterium]|jgi:acetoin utilization deacetylase AcuC-like enzyme/GNAT superfamily N-acetyltransferase|nr:acetylpolyamine amidohydrolase [Hyphomicrobiales bacterium]HBH42006.1 acetylpolyamine amidohydrolase [Hyphomicrobiales bacterium]HBR27273.1 acetylpolyamine amidohydrolase [Hyphomicrobiales bacterium]HCL62783.1 acetylpolyamine amidohydrolase [Hyphomicrobiales bacterium]